MDLAFQKLDEDGDGYISLDELMEHLPAIAATTGTQIPQAERMAEVGKEGRGRVPRVVTLIVSGRLMPAALGT